MVVEPGMPRGTESRLQAPRTRQMGETPLQRQVIIHFRQKEFASTHGGLPSLVLGDAAWKIET